MTKWLLYKIKIKDKKWKSLKLLKTGQTFKVVKVHLKTKINIVFISIKMMIFTFLCQILLLGSLVLDHIHLVLLVVFSVVNL